MASCTGTDSDNSSELTTLVSGDTPTLPGQEQPSIRALFEAQDDAAYDLAVAQIPRDHRVRVKGICGDYHEYTTPIRQSGSYVQLATTVKRAPFEEALIAFFVVCQIALRLVADELFVGFLRIVYPSIDKLLPGCGNTLRALVLEAFNKRKEHLKEVLARSVSKIHFSFDLWTSPNHLALLGVVAHFIDEFGQNQSILIAIRQLHGSHSGENQAEVIKEVIQEYNLQNRIGYFVTDNASNNNTAIDSLIARFLPHLTPKQRLGRRLRCLGHVINLSAKAFLYGTEFDAFEKNAEAFKEQSSLLKELHLWRKRGPVGKLHNIVTFICRTPQRREKFANIQSQSEDFATEFDGLKLVVDNATRWNSLYLMIERAIKLRDRIDRFCIDHAEFMHGSSNKKALSMEEQESLLKHDSLTADDWAVLTEIVAFLEKFYTLTKRAEGSKLSSDRGVLSDYLTTLNVLLKHAREYRDDINFRAENPDLTSPGIRQLRVCIVNCWTKLDEYFALVNDTPAHYAAIVTNPQMKWKYFERQWKDAHLWKDATLPESWLPGGKRALNSLWEEYKNLPVADACAGSKRARTPDEFERETDMTQWDEDEMDELETWLSMKVFKLDDDDTLPAYWLRQSKQPATQRIAKMGLDMASIPAMSSDCERVFSQCKLMITGQRNRLKPDIVEATQCLRMWLIMEKKILGSWKGRGNWKTPHMTLQIIFEGEHSKDRERLIRVAQKKVEHRALLRVIVKELIKVFTFLSFHKSEWAFFRVEKVLGVVTLHIGRDGGQSPERVKQCADKSTQSRRLERAGKGILFVLLGCSFSCNAVADEYSHGPIDYRNAGLLIV
ncbi:hypothetical protein HIM_10549 [Hirsutella minnesotensis 3608]|uniref:HAT C-terminal dimerisation domain-containing protein n=1 Tax=Hirsutella minnesotensis 3608 TaxID=1043627 RepID=A0A0F7ZG08_9HYPO|nr:hypothetical protein HIM_10549 [Hirsutella minnesotensis 3608]